MVAFPPAKINLGLNILRKRSDGYHDLATCFYPIPWCDVLEVLPSTSLKFESSGLSVPGDASDNLCLKAFELLKKDFDLPPVQIYLHKIIPMGAGLGGGSSDGAWTLRLLNNIFKLKLTTSQLAGYAAQLGSDCAFFVYDQPMMGHGRGEILSETKISLSGKFLVVVKPDIHVSTAEAFSGMQPTDKQIDLKSVLESTPATEWKDVVSNDFERTVFIKHPAIAAIKKHFYDSGAIFASMSGSGSSVFGIFDRTIDLKSTFASSDVFSAWL